MQERGTQQELEKKATSLHKAEESATLEFVCTHYSASALRHTAEKSAHIYRRLRVWLWEKDYIYYQVEVKI